MVKMLYVCASTMTQHQCGQLRVYSKQPNGDMEISNQVLTDAAAGGDTEGGMAALAAGADIHTMGSGAMHAATGYGHTETVRALLNAGVDIHAKSEGPWFVLPHAVMLKPPISYWPPAQPCRP